MHPLCFAYGSNMSSHRLRAHLPRARSRGRGWLEDKRLLCNKPTQDGSGKANLVEEAGSKVWGVLYEIERDDWPILDRYEPDYSRFACQVHLKIDQRVPAETYLWTGQGPEIPPPGLVSRPHARGRPRARAAPGSHPIDRAVGALKETMRIP
jgi:gamma-glutamylcyclotransferase (GGCT)/AIG2-like uncharacterized protein YtfP